MSGEGNGGGETAGASRTAGAAGAVGEDAKRLFVGIRVSVGTANALAGAVETLARRAGNAGIAVRWMSPTLYHVTLKFLGWTQPETISALRDGLAEAVRGVEPFSFQAARLGAFPSLDRARVVWAGVTARGGEDALGNLARRVDAVTAELGYPSERPFAGHITLGRLAEPVAISEVLLPLMEQVFSDTKPSGISLLESTLKSGGLAYREVAHFSFSPAVSSSETTRKRQSPSLQLNAQNAPSSSDPSHSSSEIETDDGWPRGHGP